MSSESANAHNGHEPGGDPAKADYGTWQRISLIAALVGVGAFVALALVRRSLASEGEPAGMHQLYLSYMVGYIFWLSLPLGSMALLMIQYFTTGQWGLLMQRTFEACTRTLPLMIVLFIPLAVGITTEEFSPYWWTEPVWEAGEFNPDLTETVNNEAGYHELKGKVDDFLNPTMFWTVAGSAFVIWGLWAFMINIWSRTPEDGADEAEAVRKWQAGREALIRVSGPGLFLHAMAITACATSWVMSLEQTWHSTMFPVIFGVNQLLTAYAFGIVFVLLMARPGYPMHDKVVPQHKIDLGSFLLAFTLFWTYINFSQYMIIWAGNLPEEIPYFLKRTNGGWEYIAYALLLFHFAMPFLLLLFRHVKYNAYALRGVALMLIVMCAFDVFIWVEPSHSHEGRPFFWLLDVAALVGIGGLWLTAFLWQVQKRELLPKYEEHRLTGGHHDDH